MRFQSCSLLLVGAILVGCGGAESLPVDGPERARALVDSALARAGGVEGLNAVRTLAVQFDYTQYPQPSRGETDTLISDVMQARDFDQGRAFYQTISKNPDREAHERVVMQPGSGFVHDYVTGETRGLNPQMQDMATVSEFQLRWYPYTHLTAAITAGPNLAFAGDTTIDNVPLEGVQFTSEMGDETLWIDPATYELRRRVVNIPDQLQGQRTVVYTYRDYGPFANIPFAQLITVAQDGNLVARYDLLQLYINPELQEEVFAPPVP